MSVRRIVFQPILLHQNEKVTILAVPCIGTFRRCKRPRQRAAWQRLAGELRCYQRCFQGSGTRRGFLVVRNPQANDDHASRRRLPPQRKLLCRSAFRHQAGRQGHPRSSHMGYGFLSPTRKDKGSSFCHSALERNLRRQHPQTESQHRHQDLSSTERLGLRRNRHMRTP